MCNRFLPQLHDHVLTETGLGLLACRPLQQRTVAAQAGREPTTAYVRRTCIGLPVSTLRRDSVNKGKARNPRFAPDPHFFGEPRCAYSALARGTRERSAKR